MWDKVLNVFSLLSLLFCRVKADSGPLLKLCLNMFRCIWVVTCDISCVFEILFFSDVDILLFFL